MGNYISKIPLLKSLRIRDSPNLLKTADDCMLLFNNPKTTNIYLNKCGVNFEMFVLITENNKTKCLDSGIMT